MCTDTTTYITLRINVSFVLSQTTFTQNNYLIVDFLNIFSPLASGATFIKEGKSELRSVLTLCLPTLADSIKT